MGDKGAVSSPVVVAGTGATVAKVVTSKKAAIIKSTKPREKPAHPKTAEMVNAAIKELKERGGSSLQAIKKYMVTTYKIDADKQATFIKKYLKAAVASGTLVQTKGKGAAGSFKLAAKVDTAKPKAKLSAKPKSPKKIVAAKTSVAPKKADATASVGQKKKVTERPAAKPPKAKSIKAKPATKSPVKKAAPPTAKKAKSAAVKPNKVTPKKAASAKK